MSLQESLKKDAETNLVSTYSKHSCLFSPRLMVDVIQLPLFKDFFTAIELIPVSNFFGLLLLQLK